MSDQPPPPKPKPGSLRDRIAAFEKPSAGESPASGPPPPRPKPGGMQWKPRAASPPPSSAPTLDRSDSTEKKNAGMSAADAKESIGLGGSLKDRMAALQGRGGFGSPSPPAPPKPVGDKPKWKPPPRIVSPPPDELNQTSSPPSIASPPPTSETQGEQQAEANVEAEVTSPAAEAADGEGDEPDPEEAERQRRANIAARMARLGGARIGMSPPVFGKKPDPKPPQAPSEPLQDNEAPADEVTSAQPPPSMDTQEQITTSTGSQSNSNYFAGATARQDSEASSQLSVESSTIQPSRSPASMPVPAVPRRAAPPRKKPAKSSSLVAEPDAPGIELEDKPVEKTETDTIPTDTSTVDHEERHMGEEDQVSHSETAKIEDDGSQHDTLAAAAEDDASEVAQPLEPEPVAEHEESVPLIEPTQVDDRPINVSEETPSETKPIHDDKLATSALAEEEHEEHPVRSPSPVNAEVHAIDANIAREAQDDVPMHESQDELPNPGLEDDDDEARRKRVAERLAKMGGFNPLAGPLPPRRQSSTVTRENSKRDSIDSVHSPTPVTSLPISHSPVEEETNEIDAAPIKPSESSEHPEDKIHLGQSDATDPPTHSTFSSGVTNAEASNDNSIRDDLRRHVSLDEDAAEPHVGGTSADQASSYNEASNHESQNFHGPLSFDPNAAGSGDLMGEGHESASEGEETTESSTQSTSAPPIPTSTRPISLDAKGETGKVSSRRPLPPPPRELPTDVPEIDSASSHIALSEPTHPEHSNVDDESESQIQSIDLRHSPPPTPPLREVGPSRTEQEDSTTKLPTTHRSSTPPLPHPPVRPPTKDSPSVILSPPVTDVETSSSVGRELLDEDEGDPIDPIFHSPARSPSDSPVIAPKSPVAISETPQPEEESDAIRRRRNLAERMAKLGGIQFGAPPIGRIPPRRNQESSTDEPNVSSEQGEEGESAVPELNEEEEEIARKQRIAAKLAGMGGMRLGMLPPSLVAPPPPPRVRQESMDDAIQAPPPPPPPPRLTHPTAAHQTPSQIEESTNTDYDVESLENTSDDDNRLAESDLVEVEPHRVDDEPPPVPNRHGQQQSDSVIPVSQTPASPPPIRTSRPPVPVPTTHSRRASAQEGRKASVDSTSTTLSPPVTRDPPSEYVMVDADTEDAPPPPPRRTSRSGPPTRGPPQRPIMEPQESQWELPTIPSSNLEFGVESGDLSMSTWSEDSTAYPPAPIPSRPPQPQRRESSQIPPSSAGLPPTEPLNLSSEELMAAWGKIGVQICDAAATSFESSKKSVIGDGSYVGFVNAVFAQVPSARPPKHPTYGYLIYAQTASSVHKRASDIMPGDIVVLSDAKLKGHKGLQTYTQNVGSGEAVVGVVGEFETKKAKVKVYQANQHVGQQSVESVSYRLEDLKSGNVQIFRVLEDSL